MIEQEPTDSSRARFMPSIGTIQHLERVVAGVLHRAGFRHHYGGSYRTDRTLLPGKPDLVFPLHKAVIFFARLLLALSRGCKVQVAHYTVSVPAKKLTVNRDRDVHVTEQPLEDGWRPMFGNTR